MLSPVRGTLHSWGSALLELLYPRHCVVCESAGAWLCTACLASVQRLTAPCCTHCGRPVVAPGLCAACRAQSSCLVAIRSVGYYVTPLREAIIALKYGGVRVLAEPLGELLAETWRSGLLSVDVVVPVPLHRSRVRYRGYNQAALLARQLAACTGLPVLEETLVRARATRSQVGLSADERRANVRDAFACATAALRGARVLMLDDVFTTGATLEASAQALLDGGAAGVWALTLARALD